MSKKQIESSQDDKSYYAKKIIDSLRDNLGLSETSLGGSISVSSSILSSISSESDKLVTRLTNQYGIDSLKLASDLLDERKKAVSEEGTKKLQMLLENKSIWQIVFLVS